MLGKHCVLGKCASFIWHFQHGYQCMLAWLGNNASLLAWSLAGTVWPSCNCPISLFTPCAFPRSPSQISHSTSSTVTPVHHLLFRKHLFTAARSI